MRDNVSKVLIILITVALFVIVVDGMRAAAAIINPFLLAVFLSSLCAPLLYWLQRRGVPNGLAVAAIVLGLLVVATPAHDICGEIVEYSGAATSGVPRTPCGSHNPNHCPAEQVGVGYEPIRR